MFTFAGRIVWSRQLFRRIEEPMVEFRRHPQLLQSNEAKKIIRNYNKLSKTLLEFELMYYRCWLSQVSHIYLLDDNSAFTSLKYSTNSRISASLMINGGYAFFQKIVLSCMLTLTLIIFFATKMEAGINPSVHLSVLNYQFINKEYLERLKYFFYANTKLHLSQLLFCFII